MQTNKLVVIEAVMLLLSQSDVFLYLPDCVIFFVSSLIQDYPVGM